MMRIARMALDSATGSEEAEFFYITEGFARRDSKHNPVSAADPNSVQITTTDFFSDESRTEPDHSRELTRRQRREIPLSHLFQRSNGPLRARSGQAGAVVEFRPHPPTVLGTDDLHRVPCDPCRSLATYSTEFLLFSPDQRSEEHGDLT